MNIIVLMKRVPDLVEDLEVDASGRSLDAAQLKFTLNEFDDHALEEALLLKDETGGTASGSTVTAVALDSPEVDKMLFTALAKGADRALKVTGADAAGSSRALAKVLAEVVAGQPHDLILTGVQAADDRDGQLAPLLAGALGLPSVEVVTSVHPGAGHVVLHKEYSGGTVAEFEVDLPAVLGIQAARQSPRYAPVSKVRQVQESATLETFAAAAVDGAGGVTVTEMTPPETGAGAQMLGDVDELMEVLVSKGVV